MERVVVIGAGPAGLTAAAELRRHGRQVTVLEAGHAFGGISQTVVHDGYRFDIGGHRFFTKSNRVQAFWQETMGEDFLRRPRLSRIHYAGKYFDYPLRPLNALFGLGPVEAVRIGLSYLSAQLAPAADERTFEDWVCNRFGRRLFEIFFKSYTEKVWGIPCSEIDSEWAAQRIKNLDLLVLLRSMLLPGPATKDGSVVTSLIESFWYPRHGPGQLWERCADQLRSMGAEIVVDRRVVALSLEGDRVVEVETESSDGERTRYAADAVISSMPLKELVRALSPAPSAEMREAADRLRYRDFLTVGLVIDREEVFPDNWIYIHSPDVAVGRIQNFKNWSPEMVPDPRKTSLGLEYFVQEGDALWSARDHELVALATRECAGLGLVHTGDVERGVVIRMPKAYPVYDPHYKRAIETIRKGLDPIRNLQTIGRNGQHRYNNQDHSMLTGFFAAENVVFDARHDVWSVNVDSAYHEQVDASAEKSSDPLVPVRAAPADLDLDLDEAFARYDPVALAGACAVVLGIWIPLATAITLLDEHSGAAPMLSLLGNYFLGYGVSWTGALLGTAEGLAFGGVFGWTLGRALNTLIAAEHRRLLRRLQRHAASQIIDGS